MYLCHDDIIVLHILHLLCILFNRIVSILIPEHPLSVLSYRVYWFTLSCFFGLVFGFLCVCFGCCHVYYNSLLTASQA